jgi:RNA polymerase sigma-70 factor (ECF subfamily)
MLGRQSAAEGQPRTVAKPDAGDEARLLERVAKGELRAFEELYRIYHPRLSRFLVTVIRRPHLVEEALNDTMLAVWSKPDSYSGASKPSTWIFAIAYRKALKVLRGQDEPLEDKQAESRPSPELGPEQQLGRRQAQAALLGAIGELSADHHAVVDLCYFHDVGYREIAEIMDCPVDTVKTRMFHARRHLKTKLAGGLADWL